MREKLSFASDYTQGAHPAVLDALLRQSGVSLPGYGTDIYTERAAELKDIAALEQILDGLETR